MGKAKKKLVACLIKVFSVTCAAYIACFLCLSSAYANPQGNSSSDRVGQDTSNVTDNSSSTKDLIPGVGGIAASSAGSGQMNPSESIDDTTEESGSIEDQQLVDQDEPTESSENAAQSTSMDPAASNLSGRVVENINKGWTFNPNTDTYTGWQFPTGVSHGAVDLPHSWEYVHPSLSYIPTMNQKTVTYSKKLDVSSYQGRKLFIKFYGVSRNADVSIDGKEVGTHFGGYSAFVFDITSFVQGKSSVNLVVKVSNIDLKSIPINVDYTQWAGIYRDVELISTADQYISTEDSAAMACTLIRRSQARMQRRRFEQIFQTRHLPLATLRFVLRLKMLMGRWWVQLIKLTL